MFGFCGRPMGRLFLLLAVLLATEVWSQTLPLTTVQDTVFRADGTPAQGTLLISWPAFTTASGQAVAAGSTSVALGAGGALTVALVSNANASPVNTVYTVVYQLNDGTVKTEYWIVPTTSPATLAAVRTTLGTSSAASQIVTQSYVNSALASKANDSAVVHNTGNETVSGVKQFSSPPSLPAPVNANDGVNKQYVDNAVQNTGSGSYLSTAGGTMTGALLLSGDPSSPTQASDKHYVDVQTSVKADLVGGLVPPSELGSGSSGPNTCLLGNQTWGPCGSGGGSFSYVNSTLIANPDFNATTPSAQNGFLNCTFQNAGSDVSLECPYGSSTTTFALGSQAVLNNQGNTFSAGVQDFSTASLKLPSGAGYMPTASGEVGYDTTANMPVINVSGITQQLALTTSNISGQANTALALAATPAQCNGSFATGIQANGNANCSVADVLELAETSQPNGIPNYGIFWFDSTTHTPRIIDNNGQVVQLGLTNVFNSDANTLQEYNGTNPQELDVFGTRPDPSDYERLRLGYGQFNGSTYFFIGPDSAGSGQQRGLAFLTATTPKWVIDGASMFKPWTTNAYDIGTSTQQVRNLYLGTGLIFASGTLTGVHGTTGIAAEAGTLGTTSGAGLCNDGNGNVTDTGCTSGAVGSVFGRTGVVTAQAGDYSVGQVTGAAALNSPAFTGAPTAPTPATNDNSTKIATTAWVNAQGYGTGGGMPSGPAIGQKAVWNGTAWVAKNDWKLDTTVFPGSDAGTRGANCLSYLANNAFYGGGVCSEENESAPDWQMDPFDGSTYYGPKYTPEKPVIIIPVGVQTKFEVPIAVAAGTTSATHTEGLAELSGPTVGAGGNQNSSGGAMLAAGSSYPPAGSTTSPCSHCTTLTGTVQAYVDDGHNSGTYCGIAMSSSTNTGKVCVVGNSSTAFTSQLVKHGYMAIPYNRVSTGQVFGHIEQIIDNQHVVLTVQLSNAPAGGLAAGQTYSVTYPGVQVGVGGLPFSGQVNQGTSVHDLSVNMSGSPGSIALANYASPELNTAYNLHLLGYNAIGADWEGSSNQTSTFHDWMLTPDPTTCQAVTTDLMVNGAAPQGGDSFVLANGQGCTGGTTQNVGIVLNGLSIKLGNIHTEQKTPALAIGYLPTCSFSPCPGILYIASSAAPHEIVADRMDSNCAVGGGCTDTVLLGNTFAAPFKIDLRTISTYGASGITNSLRDLNNGNVLTNANTPDFDYKLDSSGAPSVVAHCAEMTLGWCEDNGTLAYYSAGAQKFAASGGGATSVTPAVGDNSTKVATTAFVASQYMGTWVPLGTNFSTTGVGFNTSTGHANLFGITLREPVTTSQVTFYVTTPDNSSNTYDIGIYQGTANTTDNLLVHTGALAGSSMNGGAAGYVTLNWTSSAALSPGRYYLLLYANEASAPMTLGENTGDLSFAHNPSYSITPAGGALPSSFSAPADAFTASAEPYLILH